MLEKSVTDPDNSYLGQWTPVTIPEMKKFIGTLLLMGIVYKPDLHLYWSTDIHYSTPAFSKIMKRDRFYLILKFLHFNNNETVDPENPDRLHKVRPLIELLRERFRKVYSLGKNLSVDESLVLYKGRLTFKQYIKTKRARFGINLYELCTSSGITLGFLVYCGQGMYSDDDLYSKMPASERIPMVLMEPFLGKGHVLYTDNFCTSPLLAKHFLSKDTHLCGTIKKNRKNFCTDIVTEQLDKGTIVFYKCKETEMVAVKYRAIKDKSNKKPKIVYMLTTCHQPTMLEVDAYHPEGHAVFKPEAIKAYNHHMGGVDMVDQQLHNLRTLRKTYKWYRKLAIRLIS